ncbi:MAG: DivIVA domain-containing protein [Clostridiales bacterium]|nr:DivIVA domain-containing protein [Clostridiales bacterium]
MITPLELEKIDFKGAPLGYSKKSVDDFVNKIKDDYEKLYKENIELKDKVAMLNDSISQYKSMEEVLKTAMLAAQTSAEEIKQNAQEKAENIIQEAEFLAQKNREFSNQETINAKAELEGIKKEMAIYKNQMETMLKTQLEILEKSN